MKAKAVTLMIIAMVIALLFIGIAPAPVTAADEYFYVSDEDIVTGTGVSGDYNDTQFDDGSYRVIEEKNLGGTTIIFEDDFETDKGWTGYGGSGEWERNTPQGLGGDDAKEDGVPPPTFLGYPDPTAAISGVNIIGNDLSGSGVYAGNYENGISSTAWLTSPAMDCSGYTDVTLSFYRWLNVEDGRWDHAYIEVSNDGVSWVRIYSNPVGSGYPYSPEIDNAWTLYVYDISTVADNQPTVYVRFGIDSDGGWTYSGWNIDDLKIESVSNDYEMNVTYLIDGITTGMDGYVLNISGYSTGENFTVTADGTFVGNISYNPIFEDDFETDKGWVGYGGSGEWERNTPQGLGGNDPVSSPPGYPDPVAAVSASNVLGNDLTGISTFPGNYENNIGSTSWITSPLINCTGYIDVTLSFYRWLNVEGGAWDHAYVGVSNDGVGWNAVWQETANPHADDSWNLVSYDISEVADNQPTVYVRFGIDSDGGWTYSGWNIDDVKIEGVRPTNVYLTKDITSEAADGSVTITFVDTNQNNESIKDTLGIDWIEIKGTKDTTPPASISNIQNSTGNFWINWTWDNPPDPDFNYTMVYINGTLTINTSDAYYNNTYPAHACREIGTHTVDTSGNINQTWVNQTTTILNNNPVLELIGAREVNETETLTIDANATDLDGDTLTYSCNRTTDLFADFNTTTGTGSWTPLKGQAGIYYIDFGVYDGYGGMDNETVEITVVDTTPPAAITDLKAYTGMDIGEVYLTWTAPGDDGMNGTARGYIVRYSTVKITTQAEFGNATDYPNSWSPMSAGSSESHVITGLTPGTTYYFAIEAFDDVPNQASVSSSPNATAQNVTISPTSILLSAYPSSIEVGGKSSIISARVIGNNSQPYIGAHVSFITTLGYFNGTGNATFAITNTAGFANVTLFSSNKTGVATITAIVINTSISNTTTVTFTPGPPAILLLAANPQTVFANGIDTSTITATVKDTFENPIPGKAVTFSSLVANKTVLTNTSGQASVMLRATLKIQNVRVNASTDGLTNSTVVYFVAGPPHELIVNANPPVIATLATGYHINKSTITALVVDEWYHALDGVRVNFTTTNGTLSSDNETTNSYGEAIVILTASDTAETVTVSVSAMNGSLRGSINVTFVDIPFISMVTTIEPKSVTELPEYVNVTHTLTGVGIILTKPVDVVLVTDRSGSMRQSGWLLNKSSGPTEQFSLSVPKDNWSSLISFKVTGSVTKLGVEVYWDRVPGYNGSEASEVVLNLQRPNGTWIFEYPSKPNGASEKVDPPDSVGRPNEYFSGICTKPQTLLVENPESGTWHAAVYGWNLRPLSNPPNAINVTISVYLDDKNLNADDINKTPTVISIDAAKEAAKSFVGNMKDIDRAGYVKFSSSAELAKELTYTNTAGKASINATISSTTAGGGTAINTGIDKATTELVNSGRDEAVKAIVLLTDGQNDEGTAPVLASAQTAKDNGIIVFTIGLTAFVHEEMLREVASKPDYYYYAPTGAELQAIYEEIYAEIEAIAKRVNVNVLLPGVPGNISGEVIPNATYVTNSANISFFTYADNTTKYITHEPTITNNTETNTQNLTFTIGEPINIGDEIKISYRLLVNGTGIIISGDSNVVAGDYTQKFGPVAGPTIEGAGGGGFGNDPPVAIINANDKVHVDKQPIQFDGSSSSDSDGWIVNYTWDFGDGNITTTTNEIITHNYSAKGKYTVTLTVTDNDDGESDPDTTTVTVFSMEISKSPPRIWVTGQGVDTALITVNATRDNGTAVPGVPIIFNISPSTLGTLNPITPPPCITDGAGLATVTLTSGDTAGYATITATEQCSYVDVSTVVEIKSLGTIRLE